MKVALLCDWYLPRLGGLELHLRDLAGALAARGCQVHLITSTRAGAHEQAHRLPAAVLPEPPGVVVHRLAAPLLPRYKFVYTRAAFRDLERLLLEERYDVLHAMVGIVSPLALGGVWLGRRLGLPTVVTCHSMLSGFGPLLKALDAGIGWSRWPVLYSAVSRVVAEDLRRLVPEGPVRVLPNGVDAARWRVPAVAGRPGELRLLTVMRLNPRKRGAALLVALARARKAVGEGPGIVLDVVGEGPDGPRLRRLARRLALGEAVRFLGYRPREEVRELLSRADAFVLASRLESFGIAALEARAAGVPVVALDHGGVKEFVRHGTDGLLASGDAELAAHLVRLAREPELLAALRGGAAEQPVPFSWEEVVVRHLEAYRAVLGHGAGTRAATSTSLRPRTVTATHPAPPTAAR